VLRLASLLWRLRRATTIESGLFGIEARQLLQFRRWRRAHRSPQSVIEGMYRQAVTTGDQDQQDPSALTSEPSALDSGDPSEDLTRAYLRLTNLPTCPLDRLSRYEAALWRQAGQILFTLQFAGRQRPWTRSLRGM
jgi:hypothetical protein